MSVAEQQMLSVLWRQEKKSAEVVEKQDEMRWDTVYIVILRGFITSKAHKYELVFMNAIM